MQAEYEREEANHPARDRDRTKDEAEELEPRHNHLLDEREARYPVYGSGLKPTIGIEPDHEAVRD